MHGRSSHQSTKLLLINMFGLISLHTASIHAIYVTETGLHCDTKPSCLAGDLGSRIEPILRGELRKGRLALTGVACTRCELTEVVGTVRSG